MDAPLTGGSAGGRARGAIPQGRGCADDAPNHALTPGRQQPWGIPPPAHAALVWALEDGLAGSTRPDEPQRPQVGVDETSQQLGAEPRPPIPATPGPPQRVDDASERRGTAHLGMIVAPRAGTRHGKGTARRTAGDCAARLRDVVDAHAPQAEKMVLVLDHLHTHTPASLYEAFPPAAARRLLERRERHDTPTHGSWLHRADTARSVLATPCVDRRIPDATLLTPEVAAWEGHRHVSKGRGEWRFTTQDARITLKRRYPSIQVG